MRPLKLLAPSSVPSLHVKIRAPFVPIRTYVLPRRTLSCATLPLSVHSVHPDLLLPCSTLLDYFPLASCAVPPASALGLSRRQLVDVGEQPGEPLPAYGALSLRLYPELQHHGPAQLGRRRADADFP